MWVESLTGTNGHTNLLETFFEGFSLHIIEHTKAEIQMVARCPSGLAGPHSAQPGRICRADLMQQLPRIARVNIFWGFRDGISDYA